ncbi:MAG: Flp family type IVb pilin [Reyranella sp.]|uniref:Flp family type IVb pilin n=1 Tax=Reyranella sp. TaxID=1929291 RepID=UPI001AD5BA6A|nr:Flp family type IVb pilin [Reyranella sp.]MBN9088064.1 Flp family type IVb pilin [Reyranella sp.]
MLSAFRRLTRNEAGATAIEYTLIAGLISIAAIVAMGTIGTKVNGVLSNVASFMK